MKAIVLIGAYQYIGDAEDTLVDAGIKNHSDVLGNIIVADDDVAMAEDVLLDYGFDFRVVDL